MLNIRKAFKIKDIRQKLDIPFDVNRNKTWFTVANTGR